MLELSPDSFRALARSSPWRWTSVHFRHRSHLVDAAEAWVRRGRPTRVVSTWGEQVVDDPDVSMPPAPPLREDGLVAERLDDVWDDVDPMWTHYTWVAMLDPRELSHHVDVADLREDEVAGRPVWRATLVALPGYEPRCGGNCCDLLWSEAGLWADFSEDNPPPDDWLGRDYPTAYDVALDVATGIVVRCLPVGGDPKAPYIENDILSSH